MAGPRMQSQGNRFNIMSRKAQKKRRDVRTFKNTQYKNTQDSVKPRRKIQPDTSGNVEVIYDSVGLYPRVSLYPSLIHDIRSATCTAWIPERTWHFSYGNGVILRKNFWDEPIDCQVIAATNDLELIERILKLVHPNEIKNERLFYNELDEPLFHILVRQCNFEKVNLFIKYGMDVNKKDSDGKTAFFGLATKLIMNDRCPLPEYHTIRDMALLLVKHGGDPTTADNEGDTCLHYCLYSSKSTYIFNLFVHLGCNKNYMNNEGELPEDTTSIQSVKEEINRVKSLGEIMYNKLEFEGFDISKVPDGLKEEYKQKSITVYEKQMFCFHNIFGRYPIY